MESLEEHWVAFAVALGCGLLMGIERERRKGHGSGRAPAGVRTFAITSVAGAIAQVLEQPLLVALGALLVLSLSAISYWRERSRDPGITTELALFLAFLLGVTAVREPALAAGAAAVVTSLLAARTRLHRFATRMLSESEVRDGLILAGAALVVLPLVPDRPLPWLASINPRTLWQLVVLLLSLQAVGYVAMRALGPQVGLALSGLASGFVSSTATFAAMGARARSDATLAPHSVSGALFSNVATLVQLALVAATVSPAVLAVLWPVFALGSAVAVGTALLAAARAAPLVADHPPALERVFDVPKSVGFAAVLACVTALAAWFGDRYGPSAAVAGTALAGFVDVHASTASVCALVEGGRIEASDSALPVLLGFTANTGSKMIAAWVSGGAGFALRVLPGLLALLATVWAAALLA